MGFALESQIPKRWSYFTFPPQVYDPSLHKQILEGLSPLKYAKQLPPELHSLVYGYGKPIAEQISQFRITPLNTERVSLYKIGTQFYIAHRSLDAYTIDGKFIDRISELEDLSTVVSAPYIYQRSDDELLAYDFEDNIVDRWFSPEDADRGVFGDGDHAIIVNNYSTRSDSGSELFIYTPNQQPQMVEVSNFYEGIETTANQLYRFGDRYYYSGITGADWNFYTIKSVDVKSGLSRIELKVPLEGETAEERQGNQPYDFRVTSDYFLILFESRVDVFQNLQADDTWNPIRFLWNFYRWPFHNHIHRGGTSICSYI